MEKNQLHDAEEPKQHPSRKARVAVALFVIALMVFSLAFHSGLGSPSSFGLGTFNLLCPLGGIEALIASKTFIPVAFISLLVVVFLSLIVGRAWCAWGCPTNLVRKIAGQKKEAKPDQALCKKSFWQTFKGDSRLWVLGGVLIASLVVAIPVFCLICPIGLTFGSIMSVWRLIQFNDVNWGLLVFPIALIVEIVIYKKWCVKICPIAGLLSIFGRFAKPFRPKVNGQTCLQEKGIECNACHEACPASIDLHSEDTDSQLADCSRCTECKDVCPTAFITMPIWPKK